MDIAKPQLTLKKRGAALPMLRRLFEVRAGFLYNHDQIHQVAHSLPVALALAQTRQVEVIIAATSQQIVAEIQRIAGSEGLKRVTLVLLDLARPSSKIASRLLNSFVPARKVLILRDNLAFFRSLDAMVVTERTSLLLKQRFGLALPRMILIDHGAGDRAIGFGKSVSLFDQILAAGRKIQDRMIAEAGVQPERLQIVGYPKFDIGVPEPLSLPLMRNGRKTVLYNPHPSPHLSSWYAMGQNVLEYFYRSDRYNLIFAPHIMLFHRPFVVSIDKLRFARVGRVPLRYFSAPHIHIDLGSRFCTDMTYTNMADLYLGDASSQIYEFLRIRRPSIFLNPRALPYAGDPNFTHWQCGDVVEQIDQLEQALDTAWLRHADTYRPVQDSLFDYTFDLRAERSSDRAANAIRKLFAT